MGLYNKLLVHFNFLQLFQHYAVTSLLEIEGEENDGETEEGTYFVDQAGHYYYQAKGDTQPVMTVMPNLNDSGGDEGEEFIINQENDEEGEEGEASDEVKVSRSFNFDVK